MKAGCDCRHWHVGYCQRSGNCDPCRCQCHDTGETPAVDDVELAREVLASGPPEIAYEVDFTFPYRTRAHLNTRHAWQASHSAKKKEREALLYGWVAAGKPKPPFPATITFVRIAPRPLDEGDNLASAFKAMRDELADRLGVRDDRRGPITWAYAQERGAPNTYAVRVEMRGVTRRVVR